LPLYTVRVKGIYSTAIALALREKGFLLTDLSEVLKERLSKVTLTTNVAPDVTVKSLDNPDELLIIGYPWEAGKEVEKAIYDILEGYVSVVRGKLGLYSVVDAVSEGSCEFLLPEGLKGKLLAEECPPEGKVLRLTIVREAVDPNQEILLRNGVRVIGRYSMVHYPASGVSFSEFVRDEAKATLLATVSNRIDLKSYHVHFRSSSKEASPEEVMKEVEELAREAKRLYEEGPKDKPSLVKRGEYISIMYVPRPAKEMLDRIRSKLVRTISYHHSLRASGKVESQMVDVAEEALEIGACNEKLGLALVGYIAKTFKNRRISIRHRRPDRTEITLGPFHVDNVKVNDRGVRIVLRRTFSSKGLLDGLEVEKEPGDMSITTIDTEEWNVIHEYIKRDGRLLGVYANVNTPPEISLSGIRYLDLYVDVVMRPGEDPQIIDEEELEKAREENLVGEGLYRRAKEEARRLIGRLKAMYL
jgi:predicted RNA-binding protein associated with RNAse of E/G family